jgi:hypothetical protein
MMTFLVTIKLAPQSIGDWNITANAQGDTMVSVCQVHVKEYGYGIPCLNKSTPMKTLDRPNMQGRQAAWLELYKVTNVGEL